MAEHTIEILIYRSAGAWYEARWIDSEYDGGDELAVLADASEAEALACAESMPLRVAGERTVVRVADLE